MLTEEQILQLKNQLKKQITHLDSKRREEAETQIDSLSSEALQEMIEEQNSKSSNKGENKSIFRRIVDGDVTSVLIEKNSVSAAYMDITPISKGNIIILPKKAITDAKKLPTGCFTLAKKLSGRIISKLKASSTEIQTENKFGESYVSIVPSYEKPLNINSPRKPATIEELEQIAKLLRIKKRIKPVKSEKVVEIAKQRVGQKPRRIP